MNSAGYQSILDYYRDLWPVMKKTPTHRWAIDPNHAQWVSMMSPIERLVWGDIREEGVVLYPQHPVAGYFVDFGHPVARVAIECDGKSYHTDKAKDAVRQAAIEAKGWTVYRLSGRDCSTWESERLDDEGEPVLRAGPARQLIRDVARRHGLSARYIRQDELVADARVFAARGIA